MFDSSSGRNDNTNTKYDGIRCKRATMIYKYLKFEIHDILELLPQQNIFSIVLNIR